MALLRQHARVPAVLVVQRRPAARSNPPAKVPCCLWAVEILRPSQRSDLETAHPLIMRIPRLLAAEAALSSGISPLLCACDRPLLFFRRVLQT